MGPHFCKKKVKYSGRFCINHAEVKTTVDVKRNIFRLGQIQNCRYFVICFNSEMVLRVFSSLSNALRLPVVGCSLKALFLLCRGLGGELMRPAGKCHSRKCAVMNSSISFSPACYAYIVLNA